MERMEATRQHGWGVHWVFPRSPPNSNRLEPWGYDKELYKRRNEIERLFRKLKGFRRVFTRFDKLAVMYLAFVVFALIVLALK